MAKLTAILEKHHDQPGALISILQELQADKGYLPAADLKKVSRATRVPLSEIYSIVTFYPQFYLEKRGRHTITACCGAACHVKGGQDIQKSIETILGVIDGETTEDMRFSLATASCLGTCFAAPVMIVDKDIFGKLTSDKAVAALKKYR